MKWVLAELMLLSHLNGFYFEEVNSTIPEVVVTQNEVSSTIKAPTSNVSIPTTQSPATIPTTTRKPLFQGIRMPCSCANGECGCCTGWILDRLNQKACLNITFEPDDFALTAQLYVNNKSFFRRTVSGKNPPPMCIRVPRLPFVHFCVEFSNIYMLDRNIHVCMDAEANWEDFTLVSWSFDCVRLGASGVAVVRPEEGGGVRPGLIDSEPQTDEDYDDSAREVPRSEPVVVFDKSLRRLRKKKADEKLVRVRRLKNGGYLVKAV